MSLESLLGVANKANPTRKYATSAGNIPNDLKIYNRLNLIYNTTKSYFEQFLTEDGTVYKVVTDYSLLDIPALKSMYMIGNTISASDYVMVNELTGWVGYFIKSGFRVPINFAVVRDEHVPNNAYNGNGEVWNSIVLDSPTPGKYLDKYLKNGLPFYEPEILSVSLESYDIIMEF